MLCKRIIKIIIPITVLLLGVLGINEYNKYKDEQLIDRIRKSEYNPRTMVEVKLEEKRLQEEYNNKVQEQIDKIAEYKRSYEYKLREETRSWRLPLGITVDQLHPIKAELSFYSSLPCENGIYGLKTASGIDMKSNTVANNFLSFFTDVYIEGHGMKEVHDTGSPKYFNGYNKFDVYVPRNPGENTSDYYKRVNNMGRYYAQAYIIKEN